MKKISGTVWSCILLFKGVMVVLILLMVVILLGNVDINDDVDFQVVRV